MLNRRPLLVAAYVALGAIPIMVSCNSFSGANDLRFDEDDSNDDSMGAGGPIIPPIIGGGGEEIPVDKTVEAGGVAITAVALYQGLKVPLMAEGAPATSDLPIVANRDALIRVFVTPDTTYNGQPVIGRLYLNGGKTPIEASAALTAPSTDGDLATTINFDVPGKDIGIGTTYRIELRQNKGASAPSGMTKYPAAGAEPIQVASDGQTLKVVIVPVEYQADGSNRLPDMSAEQIKLYTDWLYSYYPIPAVELTIRDQPMPWQQTVSPNGSGWETLLSAVGDLRQQDGVPADVYYYGLFAPTDTEGQFCGGGGCVLGLANLAGPGNAFMRAAIGLGFTGTLHAETIIHELGHTHGRQHTPCGNAAGVDPDYPHSDAMIGTWGYDLLAKKLWDPASNVRDLMSYCTPYWTSDYTYKAFFERLKVVNMAKIHTPPELMNRMYNRVRVGMDGSVTWLSPTKSELPPVGFEEKSVELATEGGTQTVTGQWFPYDHIDGGILVWPATESPVKALKVTVDGKVKTLVR
ncbi:MAG: M66 family metalloprotease [Polyangiaceae bacterium]|nr:M66 family metalloprotease [Polyangiaceae bacterium]